MREWSFRHIILRVDLILLLVFIFSTTNALPRQPFPPEFTEDVAQYQGHVAPGKCSKLEGFTKSTES